VIMFELDLQLTMQAVPIPIKVVCLNPSHGDTILCDKVFQ
jgi:hypothetical protein